MTEKSKANFHVTGKERKGTNFYDSSKDLVNYEKQKSSEF